MREQPNCCYKCCHPIAKEFQVQKFSLLHIPVEDFFKSQWQRHTRSILWLIYRWCLAACFFAGVLGSLIQNFNEGIWFIYLTDWGFFLCMYTSIYGAVLVSIHQFKPEKFASNSSVAVKIYWASHTTTLVLANLITLVYWVFLFPNDSANAAELYNLWAHAFNSVLMILDHMLVAFPTRLLHVVYPFTVGLIYALFSVIYYFAGGVDFFGNRFIYDILDWSKPGLASITLVGCIVVIFVFSFLMFCLYKLRTYIHRKCVSKNSIMVIYS